MPWRHGVNRADATAGNYPTPMWHFMSCRHWLFLVFLLNAFDVERATDFLHSKAEHLLSVRLVGTLPMLIFLSSAPVMDVLDDDLQTWKFEWHISRLVAL